MKPPTAERTLQSVLLHHPKIPPPEAAYRFAHAGRKWRFAFAWPDRRIACEYECSAADERSAEKCSAAAVAGWLVIRVTAELVRNGRALALIEQAHRARS